MNDRPPRKSLFERLEKGLLEAIDHAQGKLKLRETQLEVFSPPRKLGSSDIQELREKLSLSQANLANLMSVSVRTVRSWEQGQRKPSGTALRHLEMLEHPETLNWLRSKKTSAKSRAPKKARVSG